MGGNAQPNIVLRGTWFTTTMTITTCTLAKGIPPRLHRPKPMTKVATSSKPKNGKKRAASESKDSEPVKKKARKTKQQCIVSKAEVEVEEVDENAKLSKKEVKEEDAGGDNRQEVDQEEVSINYWAIFKDLLSSKEDVLNDHQYGPDLQEQPAKKDMMLDLLTIMSDQVTVKFKLGDEKYVTEVGRWCNICK